MHALIILAHPEQNSFNSQMAQVAQAELLAQGYTVEISDLYRNGFDPVEDAKHYSSRIITDRFDPQSEQRHASQTKTLPADVISELSRTDAAHLLIIHSPL